MKWERDGFMLTARVAGILAYINPLAHNNESWAVSIYDGSSESPEVYEAHTLEEAKALAVRVLWKRLVEGLEDLGDIGPSGSPSPGNDGAAF